MNKITNDEWARLSRKKFYFGHRSVGSSIVEAINILKGESDSTIFTILETKNKSELVKGTFAHSSIGKNLYPKSKIDDFIGILDGGLGDSLDVAFMKFCFSDINRQTDINELFEYYRSAINSVKKKYPHLQIIHLTIPLKIKRTGVKGLSKRLLLMDDNPYRHKYNQLVRQSYPEAELFDIAKIEATFPDNKYNTYGLKKTPGLVLEYADYPDEGHLNEYGKLIIANKLLHFLAHVIDHN